MSVKASVTRRGAIQLGKNVACDAFDETRPIRVVTHAHADHLLGLEQSLRACEKVLMTPATRDLVSVLRSPLCLMGGFAETIDYGRTMEYGEERISFFKADHILGAAQVLVEDLEGTRIAYTGDFRVEGTSPLETDVLVMEATYGSPQCRRYFDADVRSSLVSLVVRGLKAGPVYIFGYHGKLQEAMQILRAAGIACPFVATERVFHVSKICEKHGMRLGHLLLADEGEGKELLVGRSPCVAFYHMNTRAKVGLGGFRISISGWEFDSAVKQTGEIDFTVALSDHSDFDGLMEYVRRSRPKRVIVDGYREGHAEAFVREIHRRFGLPAVALPSRSEFGRS